MIKIIPFLLLATVALPSVALAQTATPAKPVQTMTALDKLGMAHRESYRHGDRDQMGMRLRDVMSKLSPEGRLIMEANMKAQLEQGKVDHDKLRAVREKILLAMDADKFDAAVLRRAFADERALSALGQERRHDAMVMALSKLSSNDRKIITANLKDMQTRMRDRMDKRGKTGPGPDDHGPEGMMPPPPAGQ
jgi:uncharacterized membrane protein